MYKQPFDITNIILQRTISITEKTSKVTSFDSLNRMPVLRRNNKIKAIHSSLIIEANSLSLEQVFNIIDDKKILGNQKEIQEVKNAFKAYSMIEKFDSFNEGDLLKAHSVLTFLIQNDNGKYRNHNEGVFDKDEVIFVSPPPNLVPFLMKDLFLWLKEDKETPILIKSCIFHYEFVFIHPFSDGNGRLARLWQNVLLTSWNSIFEFIPIESSIYKNQKEYYETIQKCHKEGKSTLFIEFMLKMIDETLDEILVSLHKESKNISDQVNKLLSIMDKDEVISANEIM